MEVERVNLDTECGYLNGSGHKLQSVERGDQASGKGAEFCGSGMRLITHRCISFQTRRSYDAVRYHEHVHSEVALGVWRPREGKNHRTLTKVVLPVPPSPTANARE